MDIAAYLAEKRAAVEAALVGKPWTRGSVEAGREAFAQDFSPLSDMRASAGYRLEAARNMLMRYYLEDIGTPANLLEARP